VKLKIRLKVFGYMTKRNKPYKRQPAARWPSSAICGGLPFPQASLTAETAWKAGESELICLHGGLRLCRLAGDIESGRGDIKDKKRQSSYAVKSSIHAVGVKNILIFPIHEVRKEGGGGNQNSGL